jgi:N-acetylglucosaminylphosphatidylinositol deacetylase
MLYLQILTFDEKGVTQHPQHSSLSAGVKHLLEAIQGAKNKDVKTLPRLFTLKTYPLSSQFGIFSPIVEHLKLGISTLLREYRAQQEVSKGIQPGSAESKIELPNTVFVASIKQYIQAWKALLQHKSQLKPSMLALVFWGKYLWVNEWIEVPLNA